MYYVVTFTLHVEPWSLLTSRTSYPNGNAIINVFTGTMLMKEHVKVADVYCNPRRKKYCVSVAL